MRHTIFAVLPAALLAALFAPGASLALPAAPQAVPVAKPAASAPRAASRPAASPREGLAALEERLNDAADRVSVPQLLPVLGRASSARGYRLPGFGVVIVLAPRVLPGSGDVFKVLRAPRHRVRAEVHGPGVLVLDDDGELDAIERQVILLQRESEQARRAAEETQQKIVETVRVRLSSTGEPASEMTVAVTPAPPPVAPRPAAAPPHATPPSGAAPAAPPAAPEAPAAVAPEAPLPPPPPPWRYWFNVEGPRDSRSADTVVADVRGAIQDALASHPGPLGGLAPDEFVAVVVDFEDATRLAARPRAAKTLVVRARARDLAARAAGSIPPEELLRRLDVVEY
ncbi:MAG: hypothetical protein U0599_23610 [Vicinamibacteria bacterium]